MLRAHPGAFGEPPEIRRTFHIRFDCTAHTPDKFSLRVTRRQLGAAAQAGTKSRSLRGLGHGEELQLFGAWAAGRARWPAIDSRRAHGVDERAVQACIPRSDCREASSSGEGLEGRGLIRWVRHGSWDSFRN